MNHFNLPDDPDVAKQVVTAQAASEKMKLDRGFIGGLLGARDNVPNNTAAFALVLVLVTLICLISFGGGYAQNKDGIAILAPLLTLFGGYLFGRNAKD